MKLYRWLLALLVVLQISTTILTAYAIRYLNGHELNPVSAFLVGFFQFPYNYIFGFLIAMVAYFGGYYLIRTVEYTYNIKIMGFFIYPIVVFKVFDFLNDFLVVMFHFH